jgi:hypothetical protein
MMKLVVALLGYKPKNVTRKKTKPVKKPAANIEKKFKRLLMEGYPPNRARYLAKL